MPSTLSADDNEFLQRLVHDSDPEMAAIGVAIARIAQVYPWTAGVLAGTLDWLERADDELLAMWRALIPENERVFALQALRRTVMDAAQFGTLGGAS